MNALSDMRQNYRKGELVEDHVQPDPIAQFGIWFDEVRSTDILEANAVIVATVGADGAPSARTVLLKSFDHEGFVFYTGYESQKGREIAQNPAVALTFYWPALERQVRINGDAVRIAPELSDAYFATRPPGSQLGAVASPQSEVIPDRDWLANRVAEVSADIDDEHPLRRPETWGGYRVVPHTVEFWQGRPDRLHDRLRYRQVEGGWVIERLAP
ncbi:MAG TPA: pyridoxamine 5'-phosphate oxidase [Thermomicrobiales bacterium]|nr:pyridoxamine 5'-phosphate oxidase [Thermomicrobiales bacterium]